jgi:pyruvate dehydrogenase E1 component alpha subunit
MYEDKLKSNGLMGEEEMDRVRKRVEQEVEEAVAFAKGSPFPEEAELLTDLY